MWTCHSHSGGHKELDFISIWGLRLLILPTVKATLWSPLLCPSLGPTLFYPAQVGLLDSPATLHLRCWHLRYLQGSPQLKDLLSHLFASKPFPSFRVHPTPQAHLWQNLLDLSTFLMFAPHILISPPVFYSINITEAYALFYQVLQVPGDQSLGHIIFCDQIMHCTKLGSSVELNVV